jgi:hypothetical protein
MSPQSGEKIVFARGAWEQGKQRADKRKAADASSRSQRPVGNATKPGFDNGELREEKSS